MVDLYGILLTCIFIVDLANLLLHWDDANDIMYAIHKLRKGIRKHGRNRSNSTDR